MSDYFNPTQAVVIHEARLCNWEMGRDAQGVIQAVCQRRAADRIVWGTSPCNVFIVFEDKAVGSGLASQWIASEFDFDVVELGRTIGP